MIGCSQASSVSEGHKVLDGRVWMCVWDDYLFIEKECMCLCITEQEKNKLL